MNHIPVISTLVVAIAVGACAGAPPALDVGAAASPMSSGSVAAAPPTVAAPPSVAAPPGPTEDEVMLATDRTSVAPELRSRVEACANEKGAACEEMGNHFRTIDEKRAIAYYRRACDRGALGGCHGWAFVLTDGKTPSPEDFALATMLLDRACEGGHRNACSLAGLFPYWGKGTPTDRPRSARYFRKACDAGEVVVACFNLAMMMDAGELPGGSDGALPLFVRGCDAGYKVACYNSGVLAEAGAAQQTAKDAQAFFQKGCALDDSQSCEAAKGSSGGGLASGRRSATPTVTEWDAVSEVTVSGAKALGCQAKMVREWLRVSCRNQNDTGGTPTALVVTKGGKVDTYRWVKGRITSLVTPLVPGVHVEARFSWSDKSRALIVTWPEGAPRPATAGTFQQQ